MKKLRFRRKTLLRALRLAALAFLCWVGLQREAWAQVGYTAPFSGSGTTYGATSTVSYSGAYGFKATGSGYSLTLGAGVSVANNSASGYAGAGNAASPYATVTLGGGTVTNSGYIGLSPTSVTNGDYYAGLVLGAAGSATVNNYGTISGYLNQLTINAYVSGIYFDSASGSLTVNNYNGGAILTNSLGGANFGTDYEIYAATSTGSITINNLTGGQITLGNNNSSAINYGIYATSGAAATSGVNAIAITNQGTGLISVIGYNAGIGIYAATPSGGAISITNQNTASISVSGYGDGDGGVFPSTYGIEATSSSGAITIANLDTATVSATVIANAGSAYGIYAATSGAVTITNAGTVQASSNTGSGYNAYGISASGIVSITNGGTVTATASAYGNAYGISSSSSGSASLRNTATGAITASSNYGTAYGISSSGSGSPPIDNAGTITAAATGGSGLHGDAYGIYSSASGTYVQNTGTITATSTYGTAYGIYLTSPGTVYNTGAITAATAAISVPSGSTVTLAGASDISGLIKGGANAASTSTLDFSLSIPTPGVAAAKSLLDAAIATYRSALAALGGTASSTNLDGTVTLNGVTYDFEDFGTINDDIAGGNTTTNNGGTYAQVAGYNGMGATLDNLSASTNPHAVALLNALATVPTANLPAALAQLSPSKISQQMLTAPASQATFQNIELGHRLALVREGLAGGMDWSGLQFASADDPMLSQLKGQLYAYNPVGNPAEISDTAAPLSTGDQFSRWGTFLTGNAVLVDQNATAAQARIDATTIDITAGADYHLNKNWAVGFLFGYGRSTAAIDDYGSRSGDDQYRLGPYVGYSRGPWFANGSFDFAFDRESSQRAVPLLGQVATAHPDGTQCGAETDGGYEFKALDGKLVYGPTASLQYTHLDIDPYTETGSAADLSVASQTNDSLQSGLGGQASYDMKWSWNGATIRPDIHGSWLHEFMANNDTVNAAFDVPGAQNFTTTYQKQQRDSGLVGFGVQNIFQGGSLLFVNYDAQVGIDNYLAESISGGLKIVF